MNLIIMLAGTTIVSYAMEIVLEFKMCKDITNNEYKINTKKTTVF